MNCQVQGRLFLGHIHRCTPPHVLLVQHLTNGSAMPRSFLVDSLILRENSEKTSSVVDTSTAPIFPYAALHHHHHPTHPFHGCHSRKAGLLCFCPLCVTTAAVTASQLHPASPPTAPLGGVTIPPLLKASFPGFGSASYGHTAALSRQHGSGGAGAVHLSVGPAGVYQGGYHPSVHGSDPRYHCLSLGECILHPPQ